ncbi:MAG TPA: hypothetical protein ENF38_01785, partial [Candidatus Aenigmarchaeota archaeon]|nr:hypothetical protein [Candidatus Aenigmarchaeota archaeon]
MRRLWLFFFLLLQSQLTLAYPLVTQIEPKDNSVFWQDNISLICNASDDHYIRKVGFFLFNESMSISEYKCLGEFCKDNFTTLLCHFNRNLTCEDGEVNQDYGSAYSNFDFFSGKFYEGVFIDDDDILVYDVKGNLDIHRGTIEFWIRFGKDVLNYTHDEAIFIAGKFGTKDNEIHIYLNSGYLYFSIFDAYQNEHYVRRNISYLKANSTIYVAAVWDLNESVNKAGSRMELYVNASSLNNEYYDTNSDIYLNSSPSQIALGLDKAVTYRIDSVIDELRISNRVRSKGEIENAFSQKISTQATLNFTVKLSDGNYKWYCFVYDNESNYNSSVNRSFWVDVSSPPSLSWVSLYPGSEDDIDPDVEITVVANLSDPSNVSMAILHYKRSGVSSWDEVLMNYEDGLWKANFTPSSPPDLWNYRIWSNDTRGNSGATEWYNLSVEYDKTWKVLPSSIGEKYTYIGSTKKIGTLILNNTGDYPLNFRLSSNWAQISYNISNPENFDVEPKEVKAIEVNITAPDIPGEYPISIKVTTTTDGASPEEYVINGTIVAYVSGPYLKVEIEKYPNTIMQDQKTTLKARIRNIGNETAINSSLEWILPKGWINITGDLTQFIGNISSGEIFYHEIEVYLDPSEAMRGAAN